MLGVLRGGSWFRYAKYARSSYRKFFHPDGDGDGTTSYITDFGCRLVINLDEQASPETGMGDDAAGALLPLAENPTKHVGNPVLDVGKAGEWDDQSLGCFSVSEIGGQFMLWYMGADRAKGRYQIGLATSSDGLQWKRSSANPVIGPGAMPGALKDGDNFYMLYSAAGGFSLATSADGVRWQVHASDPVFRGVGESNDPCLRKLRGQKDPTPIIPLGQAGEFDSDGHAGPEVLREGNSWFLFYLGSDKTRWSAGVAVSGDGKDWRKSTANPVLDIGGSDAWDGGSLMGLDVHWRDGLFHVWYAAHARAGLNKSEAEAGIRIGYATSVRPVGQSDRRN